DAGYAVISPGYLKAMGIPLVSGRDFNDQDSENGQPVALISADMARKFFPGVNPIGKRIWFDSYAPKPFWLTIVGVAADTRQAGVTHATYPLAYVVYTQQQNPSMLAAAMLVVRTRTEPASLTSAIAQEIRAVNPEAAPVGRTMDAVLSESLARQRFQMRTLMAFGCLALLLATVGLYGVLSYMVTANKAQISIRLALGANPASVFRMVVGRAMALCGLGAAAGVVGCIAARSALAAMLYGIGPTDPITVAAAVATLLAAGLVAAWIPARSAMKVDPMMVLREE
ncbi:MAG TPA: ABC transporter permease, partial [Bryobacteraceae bacterium]